MPGLNLLQPAWLLFITLSLLVLSSSCVVENRRSWEEVTILACIGGGKDYYYDQSLGRYVCGKVGEAEEEIPDEEVIPH